MSETTCPVCEAPITTDKDGIPIYDPPDGLHLADLAALRLRVDRVTSERDQARAALEKAGKQVQFADDIVETVATFLLIVDCADDTTHRGITKLRDMVAVWKSTALLEADAPP